MHSARHLVNAILYVMKQGCAWRALPHDFPPWKTVYCAKNRWTNRIGKALAALRVSANPSVGILDSTFIESSYGGSQSAPNGYKRATGCGVHVLVDKHQHVLSWCTLPGRRPDVAGARAIIPSAKRRFPTLTTVLGDKAYAGRPLHEEMRMLGVHMDAASPALPKGVIFSPMPLRWRIEQFFSRLVKWRRVSKDWAKSPAGFASDVAWCLLGVALRRRR